MLQDATCYTIFNIYIMIIPTDQGPTVLGILQKHNKLIISSVYLHEERRCGKGGRAHRVTNRIL